jgi:hypothetical protein
MSSTFLNSFDGLSNSFSRNLKVIITVVILNAGENAVVSFTAKDAKNIGLVRVLARQLAKIISEMLPNST